MSVLWQQGATLLAHPDGRLIKCDICPCDRYYIATLCPTGICGDSNLIGSYQDTWWDDGNWNAPLMALVIEPDATAVHDSQLPTWKWRVVECGLGQRLKAIKHQTATPPMPPGYAVVRAFFNGTLLASWTSPAYTTGEHFYIGDGVLGSHENLALLEVDKTMDSPGVHRLDLQVRWHDMAGKQLGGYTSRTVLRVPDFGYYPTVGAAFVLPSQSDPIDVGEIVVPVSHDGAPALARVRVLLGPFDTEVDANAVLSGWADIIADRAAYCCPLAGCDFSTGLGYDSIAPTASYNGWYKLLRSFAGNWNQPNWGCPNASVAYDVSCGEYIRLVKTDAYGNKTVVPCGSGILLPCETIETYATAQPPWDGRDGYPHDYPGFEFSGDHWYAFEPEKGCGELFCDDESPNAPCPWTEEDWEAVPSSSAALRDWEASQEV